MEDTLVPIGASLSDLNARIMSLQKKTEYQDERKSTIACCSQIFDFIGLEIEKLNSCGIQLESQSRAPVPTETKLQAALYQFFETVMRQHSEN